MKTESFSPHSRLGEKGSVGRARDGARMRIGVLSYEWAA